jgi:hypothetical protein
MDNNFFYKEKSEQEQKIVKIKIFSLITCSIMSVLQGLFFTALGIVPYSIIIILQSFIYILFLVVITQGSLAILGKNDNTYHFNIKVILIQFFSYIIPCCLFILFLNGDYLRFWDLAVIFVFNFVYIYLLCRMIYLPSIIKRNKPLKQIIVYSWKMTRGKSFFFETLKKFIFPVFLLVCMTEILCFVFFPSEYIPIFSRISFELKSFLFFFIPSTAIFILFPFLTKGILYYNSLVTYDTDSINQAF